MSFCTPQKFQSTLPRRERHRQRQISEQRGEVSIHAPTKGATQTVTTFIFFCFCFNPRSHEGSDTRLRGGDILGVVSIHAPTKGATLCGQRRHCRRNVSIHAPTKGATLLKMPERLFLTVSIHAPTKGATKLSTYLPTNY